MSSPRVKCSRKQLSKKTIIGSSDLEVSAFRGWTYYRTGYILGRNVEATGQLDWNKDIVRHIIFMNQKFYFTCASSKEVAEWHSIATGWQLRTGLESTKFVWELRELYWVSTEWWLQRVNRSATVWEYEKLLIGVGDESVGAFIFKGDKSSSSLALPVEVATISYLVSRLPSDLWWSTRSLKRGPRSSSGTRLIYQNEAQLVETQRHVGVHRVCRKIKGQILMPSIG